MMEGIEYFKAQGYDCFHLHTNQPIARHMYHQLGFHDSTTSMSYELILEHNGYLVLTIPDGVDYTDFDVKLVNYLLAKDISTLSICIECQMMGKTFNGDIDFVENVDTHLFHKDYAHILTH